MPSVQETVIDLIATEIGYPAALITPETTMDDIGADSIDVVDLCLELEEEYQITIEDDEIKHWRTVGDVIAFIEKKTAR